ncbi:MAG: molybdopterin-dependent oxidoreductase [SAR324 cluster bacterium]|nr:molybdopterin-dependent oxidoreductase [SAR324 cluster bacterium]
MTVQQKISLCHWGAFRATIEDGLLTKAVPFQNDGAPSDMIGAWPELVYSPLRIDTPMVRSGFLNRRGSEDRSRRGQDPFVSVSWDKALALVAEELERVRAEHGPRSVFGGSYGWSSAGRFHHARSQVRRFLSAGGGFVDQIGNYSWGAAQAILPHIVGDFASVSDLATVWPTIIENSKLLVAFGGLNPKNWSVTSGGAGEHRMKDWIRRAHERKVRFISISPFKGDIPNGLEADWIAVKPGSDTALMLSLAHTIIAEGQHDAEFLEQYTSGFEKFRAYLFGKKDGFIKDAEWASGICGIAADEIIALARLMAKGRTMLTASWSLQRGDHGEQPYWALIALASLLGEVGLPGGGYSFGYGSMNGIGAVRRLGITPIMEGLPNPARTAIPVARVSDMLLNPGETISFNGGSITYPEIHMIYWAGGNPFHHHQDLNRFSAAWSRPETIIVHDCWWTPTARRADIVLPTTTSAERTDIGGSNRDPYIFAMPKLIDPVGNARDDFSIFSELAERLKFAETFTGGRRESEWLEFLFKGMRAAAAEQGIPAPDQDNFWSTGYWELPPPDEDEVLLSDFRRDPKGNRLATPSGRIELYSSQIAQFSYDDCPPHPAWLSSPEGPAASQGQAFPLQLVTNQPAHRLHSQLGQTSAGRQDEIAGREPVMIHPRDAAARGIDNGDVVRVFNERGACLAGAKVSEDLRIGAVLMATGSWYDPVTAGKDIGLDKRGNPNVLTRDKGTSRLGQAVSALTVLVEVEKFKGELPEITVFNPPLIQGP